MEQLPDAIVLDFLEWLKKQVERGNVQLRDISDAKNSDMCDIFLQEKSHEHIRAWELSKSVELYLSQNCAGDIAILQPEIQLLVATSDNVAARLSFLNWLTTKTKNATDVRKMPSLILEEYVDKYIKECHKTPDEKKTLLKANRCTSWAKLFRTLSGVVRPNSSCGEQEPKTLRMLSERYVFNSSRCKCLILPLSDRDSQREYGRLIVDFWHDLNASSGEYLDIYYCEADKRKTSYDIARCIKLLPESLKLGAPCLVVWRNSIEHARSVSIRNLDSEQVFTLIKSVVQTIADNKAFDEIIEEAAKMAEDFRQEKQMKVIISVNGDGNFVGDNNTVGTFVSGTSNEVTGNTYQSTTCAKPDMLRDFDSAIKQIGALPDIDSDIRKQLLEIIELAKQGVSENSQKKQEEAKEKFKWIKAFLRGLPQVLGTLANIASIASFFGI